MLVVISSVVFARADNPAAATRVAVVKEGTIFKLYYKAAEQMDVKVSINDAAGQTVFTEVFRRAAGFVRPYNFTNLPEGDYTMVIADQNGKQIESITYKRDKIEKLAHLTKVSGSEKYVLTVPNREPGFIQVRIFDANNTIIYNQSEPVSGDFGKMYNLEKYSGTFSFEITDKEGITRTLNY